MNERRLVVVASIGIALVLLVGVVAYAALLLRLSAPGLAQVLQIVASALLLGLVAIQVILLRATRGFLRSRRRDDDDSGTK